MALQDPNLGLNYGWTLGENGWNTGMDANLKRLGAVLHLSVASRAIATPPASPAPGARYLIPTGADGDWAGKTGQIAVYAEEAWAYYAPASGWLCWVEAEAVLLVYAAGAWAAAAPPASGGATTPGDIVAAYISSIYSRYIVPAGSTGEWAGKDGQIATFTGSGYTYLVPVDGQLAFDDSLQKLLVYSQGVWLNAA